MMGKTLDDYFLYVNRIQSSQSYLLKGLGFVGKRLSGGKTRQLLIGNFLYTDWKWGEITLPCHVPVGHALYKIFLLFQWALRTSA